MKKTLLLALLFVAFSAAGASAAPVTKQNGRNAVFSSFTPICSMPAFVNYGYCNGNAGTFADVAGRIDAVQAKAGRWNLSLTFTHLSPGVSYTLWGNRSGATPTPGSVSGFFVAGTSIADAAGTANFDYQTTSPTNLGFDLNTTGDNVTIVTSWWSSQWLHIFDSTGTLFVP
jgi:opacity protein-like surface antigen